MSVKKNDMMNHIQYDFISIIRNGEKSSQSGFCCKGLSNDFLKSTKCKQHFLNVHPQNKEKGKNIFEIQRRHLKGSFLK